MAKALLILYFANAMILILHEIDSAYWKEWNQFHAAFGWFALNDDKKNMGIFLLLHIPLISLILIGLLTIYEQKMIGFAISLVVAAGGIFAFLFHGYHIGRGRREFTPFISRAILWTTFILSLPQLIISMILFIG